MAVSVWACGVSTRSSRELGNAALECGREVRWVCRESRVGLAEDRPELLRRGSLGGGGYREAEEAFTCRVRLVMRHGSC